MIGDMLRGTAARTPDGTAVVFGKRTCTYRELTDRVAAFGGGLAGLGVRAGDCVLVVLPNCPEFVVAYFATAELAATVQAVDPRLTEHEHARLVRDCAPAVVVCTAAQADRFRTLAPESTVVVVGDVEPGTQVGFTEVTGPAPARAEPAGPWVYTYSSGSTGEPKRVCRSQANQVAEAGQIVTTAAVTAGDVILCPVPLFHALGQFCCMIVAARAGAALVLLEPDDEPAAQPSYVGQVADLVAEHRVTIMPAVPYVFEALADLPADREADFSSVRLCLSGSNFLAASVRDRFEARFGVPIRQTYGSSEAGSVSWDCDPDTVTPDSVGRPLRGVRVEIVDERDRPLPAGAVGEIVVTSDAVMVGYAGDPPTTARRHRTGDLGALGANGLLRLTGRKRLLVDTGGHKVNPVEVEDVLATHPDVAAAAVVGVPLGGGGGDLLAAAVVPRGELDLAALREFCRTRLAHHKVPARFEVVADLPRSALGKVLRADVAARLAATAPDGEPDLPDVWREPDPARRAGLIAPHLARRAAAILGVATVPTSVPLRTLGLDSLGALRLKMAVQRDWRRLVRLPDLLGPASVRLLATQLSEQDDEQLPDLAAGVRAGEFPLSHNQSSIWHADVVAPDSAAYNQSFAARITSACDPDELRRAFQALVDRHPVLRTTFSAATGTPVQRVHERATVDLRVVAVAGPDVTRADLAAEALRPFDLGRDWPLRVRLFTGGGAPVLLVTQHHIVTDYWSLVTLLREIGTEYGTGVYRPPLSHTYTDYGRWLAETVAGPVGERDRAHWHEVLRERPPALELPLDRTRPAVQSRLGATHFHELDPTLVAAVREFAADRGSTVYSVLLAAFHVLLHACTGEQDVAVAAITTSRHRAEFADVLGYFVNPVVCRAAVDPGVPFEELAVQVRQSLVDALEHQLLPFGTVVDELGGRRDRGRAPLVEVAFGQNKAHDGDLAAVSRFLSGGSGHRLRVGALDLESVTVGQRGVVFDFSGAVYESGESISIAWEYDSALFDEATVRRVAGLYEHLTGALLAAPRVPLRQVGVVPERMLARLLAASRGAPPAPPRDIAGLVAAATPDTVAVVAGPERLTYGELTRRAGALGDRIRAVAAGSVVGLRLASPADRVVAALAVLSAGAAVDAGPDVRDADLVLTTTNPPEPLATRRAGNAAANAAADPPALVLRTATGRIVHMGHEALARYVSWFADTYGSGTVLVHGGVPADRALARALAVLAAGGTVVCPPTGATAAELADLLTAEPVDLVCLTPRELACVLPPLDGRPPRVGTLALSGAPLPADLVRRWRALAGETARVVHEYGGADTGLVVAAGEAVPGSERAGVVAAGRPVPGAEWSVVDGWGRRCPVGVPGELRVGGQPTGDLAVHLDDGDVVVTGRADRVVTVRGYRVDLGEVERALAALPAVRHATVTTGMSATCVVDGPVTGAGLRDALRERVADYLVPTEITVTGATAPDGDAAAGPGMSPVEARLAEVWSTILGVERVGPLDDYFDLDGDSITAVRIVSAAAEAGLRITPRQLFTRSVLRDLAAVAEIVEPAGAPKPRTLRARAVPLTPVQRWFFGLGLANVHRWNQSILLHVTEPLDPARLRTALRAVAAHHPAFRLRFVPAASGWEQRLDPDAEPVRIVDRVDPAGLNLTEGPVFAAAITPGDPGRLLLTAHHLVVDFVSWQVVLDDLTRACEQLRAGRGIDLPPAGIPFPEWADLLERHATTPAVRAELATWPPPTARDADPAAAQRHTQTTSAALSTADTQALLAARPDGARPHEIVLAAVAGAVASWQGTGHARVDVESHGRDGLVDGADLGRTVGWFTSIRTVDHTARPGRSPADVLRDLRAAGPAPAGPPATVNLNYLGRLGRLLGGDGPAGLFTPVPLDGAADRDPDGTRPYPLEISALVESGRLAVRVGYSGRLHRRADVDALVAGVLDRIRATVA